MDERNLPCNLFQVLVSVYTCTQQHTHALFNLLRQSKYNRLHLRKLLQQLWYKLLLLKRKWVMPLFPGMGNRREQGLPQPNVSVPKAQQCWQQLFLRVNRCSAGQADKQSWWEGGQLHTGRGEEAAQLLTKLTHVHHHVVFPVCSCSTAYRELSHSMVAKRSVR